MQSIRNMRFTIQINKHKYLADLLVFVGFLLDFLFSGKTLGQVGFLMVVGAGVFCVLQQRPIKFHWCLFLVGYLLLIAWAYVGVICGWSVAPSLSMDMIGTMIKCLGYMFFAYQYIARRSLHELTTFFMMVGLALTAYLVLTGAIFSGDRLEGSGVNANGIGMLIAFTMVMMEYRFITKSYDNAWPYGIILCVFLFVIILSGSRKSLILCGLPLLIAYLFQNKRKFMIRVVAVIMAIVVAYLLIMYVPVLYRSIGYRIEELLTWLSTGETDEASMLTRFKYIKLGFDTFMTKPWTGIGLSTFATLEGSYGTYSHNNFIELLVSGGIPALVAFYLPFIVAIWRMIRRASQEKNAPFAFFGTVFICQVVLHSAVVVYYTRRELFIYLLMFSILSRQFGEIQQPEVSTLAELDKADQKSPA